MWMQNTVDPPVFMYIIYLGKGMGVSDGVGVRQIL